MPILPRHAQSVGALALQSPLALATFTPTLRCLNGNPEFARLSGQAPDRLPGLAWHEIFPRTGAQDLAVLRAVLAGTSTGITIDLPGVRAHRRSSDQARLDREQAGATTVPAHYPATVYLIDVPGAAPLLGVTSRRRHHHRWSTDDIGGLSTDTSAVAVGERIDQLIGRRTWGARWVVLLGAELDTSSDAVNQHRFDRGVDRGFDRDAFDLLGLSCRLVANFREDDCLSVLDGRDPVLACPIDDEADAGLLADRFRATVRRWSDADARRPAFRISMALGRRRAGPAVELLALLGSSSTAHRTGSWPAPGLGA